MTFGPQDLHRFAQRRTDVAPGTAASSVSDRPVATLRRDADYSNAAPQAEGARGRLPSPIRMPNARRRDGRELVLVASSNTTGGTLARTVLSAVPLAA